MQIQVNYASLPHSDAIDEHVHMELKNAIGRFSDRLTRVEVHLSDENSHHKHGERDKKCKLEARPAGRDPIVVDDESDDLYVAVKGAAGKLERALARRLDPHS